MSREHEGNYSSKHGPQASLDPALAQAVKDKVRDGTISCPAAFSIVETSGAEPAQVGQTLDLMEVRLVGCQLGLFGHNPEEKPVRPAESVSSELSARIKAGLKEGRLPCAAAWAIAEELKLPKMAVSSASEKLGIKIKPCQLGAF